MSNKLPRVFYKDLVDISYQEAWDLQTEILNDMIRVKRENRSKDPADRILQNHHLLFCEHPPVYTLGKSGSTDNLLLNDHELKNGGFEFFKINRGGDITYHGPGQITGYPIFDLDDFFTDVHKYVRCLEEVVIQTIKHYGIKGNRIEGYTGVWIQETGLPSRKICAIGVHLSRWITMHGFALNVNTNLDHFKNIIPCGINDENKEVSSLEKELNRKVDIHEVKEILKINFAKIFDFKFSEDE